MHLAEIPLGLREKEFGPGTGTVTEAKPSAPIVTLCRGYKRHLAYMRARVMAHNRVGHPLRRHLVPCCRNCRQVWCFYDANAPFGIHQFELKAAAARWSRQEIQEAIEALVDKFIGPRTVPQGQN